MITDRQELSINLHKYRYFLFFPSLTLMMGKLHTPAEVQKKIEDEGY